MLVIILSYNTSQPQLPLSLLLPAALLSPKSIPSALSLPRKEQTSLRQQLNTAQQDMIRQDTHPHIRAGWGKGSQEQVNESETPPHPLSGVPTEHQDNNHNIYRGPSEDPSRLCDWCFSLCEPPWDLVNSHSELYSPGVLNHSGLQNSSSHTLL